MVTGPAVRFLGRFDVGRTKKQRKEGI
jgi:hypothetical protein